MVMIIALESIIVDMLCALSREKTLEPAANG